MRNLYRVAAATLFGLTASFSLQAGVEQVAERVERAAASSLFPSTPRFLSEIEGQGAGNGLSHIN